MASKINRILIPVILLLLTSAISYSSSAAQNAPYITFAPLVTNRPASWIGPYGGTLVSMAFDPTNPLIMYAGTFGSGVYKSANSGRTWTLKSQGITNLFIYSLAIDPQHPSTLFAGTYRNQVFKSTDGGDTWSWSGNGMQSQAIVYSIAIDPVTTNVIYASTRGLSNNGNAPWSGVLYKSANGGATWTPILEDLGGASLQDWAYSVLVNPHAHNEVLIAAHESGPFESDDYGNTWFPIDNGIQDYSGRALAVGLQNELASTYYYGVWHLDTIYKSLNSGTSWFPINQGIPYQHVYDIELDPQNGNNIYLATFRSGVLKSNDGGDNWQSGGLAASDIYTVVVKPDTPNYMLASTEGDGLYRSSNYATDWIHSNSGIENSMTTSLVLSPVDTDKIYSSIYGAGIYRSVDQGQNWNEFNLGLTDRFVLDMVMDPAHPEVLFALTNDGGLFRNDANTSIGWLLTGDGLPLLKKSQAAFPDDHPFATLGMKEDFADQQATPAVNSSAYVPLLKMEFAPSDAQIAYIGTSGSGVYRSSNGGQSWQAAGLDTVIVNSLAVDKTNPNLVYAATDVYGSILMTTDGGINWHNYGLSAAFYSVAASPSVSGLVYAGTSNGVYKFQAGIFTSLGLLGQKIMAIKLDPSNPNYIYAGTDQNAYYTLNGGQSWYPVNDAINGRTIYSISIDPFDPGLVYFCTTTHGIFLMAIQ